MPAAGVSAAETFIRQHLELAPLSFRPDISIYRPTPRSGLIGFLATQGCAEDPPYWAYAWAGGAALALYLKQNPEAVAGRTVLDFGAGSGLVAIAAAKAGALVTAFEPDPIGRTAAALNAAANGATITMTEQPTDAEIVLAGDVFYDATVAARTLPQLGDMAGRGAKVLVGDPYRRDLPLDFLTWLADYEVSDFGAPTPVRTGIFSLDSTAGISAMPG